jgi:hypothetical protein
MEQPIERHRLREQEVNAEGICTFLKRREILESLKAMTGTAFAPPPTSARAFSTTSKPSSLDRETSRMTRSGLCSLQSAKA